KNIKKKIEQYEDITIDEFKFLLKNPQYINMFKNETIPANVKLKTFSLLDKSKVCLKKEEVEPENFEDKFSIHDEDKENKFSQTYNITYSFTPIPAKPKLYKEIVDFNITKFSISNLSLSYEKETKN